MEGAINKATAKQLAAFIERIERLTEEEAALKADKREVFAEASELGVDAKAIRKIIARRKKDPDALREETAIEDTYLVALGTLVGTPLGQWARDQVEAEGKGRTEAALNTSDVIVQTISEAMGLVPAE
jgi:uncharacterized protein (UPF0335 family)